MENKKKAKETKTAPECPKDLNSLLKSKRIIDEVSSGLIKFMVHQLIAQWVAVITLGRAYAQVFMNPKALLSIGKKDITAIIGQDEIEILPAISLKIKE